jgi:pimeloyl-ACP methyl ester carboxylesterase
VSGATPNRARVGLISLGAGLAAAGVGAAIGLAAERAAFRRRRDPDGVDYTALRTPGTEVIADDGTVLHVEVDEPDPPADGGTAPGGGKGSRTGNGGRGNGGRGRGGRGPEATPTLVFSHGYALSLDSWYYQREALRGRFRLVFWDQRGHGRSGEGPDGSATIDQLGSDLRAVLRAVAPDGPLVLIGHSMGGMTVMSLAEREPELFRDRVLGVALVSTSAGGLADVDFGIPGLGSLVRTVGPPTLRVLTRTPKLVAQGRKLGSDLETFLVGRYSYASPVPPSLVRFTAEMIAATRLNVISDFLPAFSEHDKREALAALDGIEMLVIVGDSDLLTPADHSEEIVHRLPAAEHVVVRRAGHLLMLEHPDVLTGHLVELVERAMRAVPQRPGRVRRTVTPLRRKHRDGAA